MRPPDATPTRAIAQALSFAVRATIRAHNLWASCPRKQGVPCATRASQCSPVSDLGGATEATLCMPGVGAYTSRSVASIGCQEAVAAVDANVVRVLARLSRCTLPSTGLGAASYQALADQLLDSTRPGDFNQVCDACCAAVLPDAALLER